MGLPEFVVLYVESFQLYTIAGRKVLSELFELFRHSCVALWNRLLESLLHCVRDHGVDLSIE